MEGLKQLSIAHQDNTALKGLPAVPTMPAVPVPANLQVGAQVVQTLPAGTPPVAAATPAAAPAQAAASAAPPPQNASPLQGVTLVDASAAIGAARNLQVSYSIGADNQLSQIRVVDPQTQQVIAVSPPDSIARMQQEVAAYQDVARRAQNS